MSSLSHILNPSFASTPDNKLDHEIQNCPEKRLRQVLRDVCRNNLTVATAMHQALCIDQPFKTAIKSATSAVVDLTNDPDSDKENAGTSQLAGRKRKAEDQGEPKGRKSRVTETLKSGTLHFKDRYVHCTNCYELFDVLAPPCHEHGGGRSQSQGCDSSTPLSDSDDDGNDDGQPNNNGLEHDEHDCVYHKGYLEVDWEGDFWADHEEDIHGTIDSEELRREYPEGYTWDCCDRPGDAEGCRRGKHRYGGGLKHYARINKVG